MAQLKPSDKVKLGSEEYDIRPMTLAQSMRALQLTVSYMGKGSGVVRAFAAKEDGDDTLERIARVMTAVAVVVDEEQFQRDFLEFLSCITKIPQDTLLEQDTAELIDALPKILERSRFIEVYKMASQRLAFKSAKEIMDMTPPTPIKSDVVVEA